MRNLEQVASEAFTRFSMRTLGKQAPFYLLDRKRKIEWIEETQILLDELIEIIKIEINVKSPTNQPQASYEMGFLHGSNTERGRILAKLEEMKIKYQEELNNLFTEKK